MSSPALNLPVNTDGLEQLGAFKELSKAAGKELNTLNRQMEQSLKKGEQIDAATLERFKTLEAQKKKADEALGKQKEQTKAAAETKSSVGKTKEALEGIKALLAGAAVSKLIKGEKLDVGDIASLVITTEKAALKIAEKFGASAEFLGKFQSLFAALPIVGEAIKSVQEAVTKVADDKKTDVLIGLEYIAGKYSKSAYDRSQKELAKKWYGWSNDPAKILAEFNSAESSFLNIKETDKLKIEKERNAYTDEFAAKLKAKGIDAATAQQMALTQAAKKFTDSKEIDKADTTAQIGMLNSITNKLIIEKRELQKGLSNSEYDENGIVVTKNPNNGIDKLKELNKDFGATLKNEIKKAESQNNGKPLTKDQVNDVKKETLDAFLVKLETIGGKDLVDKIREKLKDESNKQTARKEKTEKENEIEKNNQDIAKAKTDYLINTAKKQDYERWRMFRVPASFSD